MSASRWWASWRRAAISPKMRRTGRDRFRAVAGRHRSGRGRARRRAAAARGSGDQRAGGARIQARRRRRGDRGRAGARQGAVSACGARRAMAIEPRVCLAEYDAGRDALTLHSATQIPGIVRDALAHGARHAGPSDPRGRARCRRRLRRQGLALPGRDFRLRRGAAARAFGQVDQRPHGGPRPPPARASTRS